MTEAAASPAADRTDAGAASVVHEVGSALAVSAHGVELLRYTYQPATPASECPSPHFHPLRSLAGDVVTGNRPHDHRWHKGLAMTASHLSGQNFWGGGTYVPGAPGAGYVDLPNVGGLVHAGFAELAPGGRPAFTEHVDWVTAEGERWIEEVRRIAVRDVDLAGGSWALEFATELRNVRGEPLEFGSPTVFGRELAGYCGFFWRGPRSFTDGVVIAADGGGGPEMMGERASWLAYVGVHDEVDRSSTLLFLDAGEPPHWFVRTTPYPVVNPSLAFFSARELPAGESMALRYRMVVAEGAWDRGRLDAYVREHGW